MYTSRVLLSGIHLTNTGEVVGHCQLWHGHDLPYVSELIAAKREGEHRKLRADVQEAGDRFATAMAELGHLLRIIMGRAP